MRVGEAQLDAEHRAARVRQPVRVVEAHVGQAGVVLVEAHPEQARPPGTGTTGGVAARPALNGTMIDTQSPTCDVQPVGQLGAQAIRPTSVVALPRRRRAGSGQLAGAREVLDAARRRARGADRRPPARGRSLSGWRRPARSSPRRPRTGTCAIRTTPGMPAQLAPRCARSRARRRRCRRRACTMRCAFSASTLSWNSRSKPLVTARTTTSDATPSTTPIVDTVVKTEKSRSSRTPPRRSARPPARDHADRLERRASARVHQEQRRRRRAPAPARRPAPAAPRGRRPRCR